ncbi:protein prenyltransferase alpha subunit repeat-containing protein 1, partial [Clarias magur]
MAESEEEVDVLVQRVVKDITNAFKRNPGIDEIGLIPCPEARYNRSPIVLVENKLGVESWCVKFLLPYVHNKLLLYRQRKQWLDRDALVDITTTVLLLNPDFTTAWNVRKELLQRGVLNPEKDLYLGKLALTKFPKSPETWIHRRWVLQRLQKELCEADGRNDYSEHMQRAAHEEMKVCGDAAGRYPSNYNAWSHRIWVLQHLAKGNLKILHDELSSTRLWVSMHVSDHSGFHYRQFLLKTLLAELDQAQHPNRGGSVDEPHADAVPQLCHDEIELCKDLIESYPGHESLWCHSIDMQFPTPQ